MEVTIIPALEDNYIYLLTTGRDTLVIDPGEVQPVLSVLKKRDLRLTTILNTHYHGDHMAGNRVLKQATGCVVVGPDPGPGAAIDRVVGDGDQISLGPERLQVLATPGHSGVDVSYFLPAGNPETPGMVWTGDILFVGGCGRLGYAPAAVLWASLGRLASLPEATRVYCGHDYGVENHEFAMTLEPHNATVRQRLAALRQTKAAGRPDVPSTIAEEKRTNCFLRSGSAELKQALDMSTSPAVEVFAELRRRKDRY